MQSILNSMTLVQNADIIKEKVRSYVSQFAYSIKGVQDDTLILKEGNFDSMGFVMLISFINEDFNITITDEELIEENFESINAITDFVVRKSVLSIIP
jgi:acyl carrier protein